MISKEDIRLLARSLVQEAVGNGSAGHQFGELRIQATQFLSPPAWITALANNDQIRNWVERGLDALEGSTETPPASAPHRQGQMGRADVVRTQSKKSTSDRK